MIDTYAVIGNPVKHSLSPHIHQQFAEQTAQKLQYKKILAPRDAFAETLMDFIEQGGKGANITIPFKQQALQVAGVCSEQAKIAQAANTLLFNEQHEILADNTDGLGLIRDLQDLEVELYGKRILLLGSGGAAQGILGPLLSQGPALLHIANRSPEKAKALANQFAMAGTINHSAIDELHGQYDIAINATSSSLQNYDLGLASGLLSMDALAYDLAYGYKTSSFESWALSQGAQCHTGIGMLVEQAAESFYLWRGVMPDVASTKASLKLRT